VKIATAGSIAFAAVLTLGLGGCNRAQNVGPDPASANMAPSGPTEPVAREDAPVQPRGSEVELSQASMPPPALPEYSQPPCPGENYMWTPGYWAYSTAGYYWTPGAWVEAPYTGALWTPPWWGYSSGNYIWHAGYWGPYVGFYGGIDYGFGYTGRGFYGGYWQSGAFVYNRSVTNVNTTVIRNVYERRVTNFTSNNRVSYNGGNGGINIRPSSSEQVAMRARRLGSVPAQVQYQREAASNRAQFAAVNHGRPEVAVATPATVGIQGGRRGAGSEAFGQRTPAVNTRPEGRGPVVNLRPEPRGSFEARGGAPPVSATQGRGAGPAVNARPEPRGGFEARGGAAAVNARPAPYEPQARPAEPRMNPAVIRHPEPQSNRPAIAARPAPEQRPSPFRPPNAHQTAPQPRQQFSADRQASQPRPQAPAARPAPPEARPAPHAAPEARPAEPQGRPAPAGHPEPQGRGEKHSK
jgi:WXXGXW repeat (2 copies)